MMTTNMHTYLEHFQRFDSSLCVKVNHISQYRLIRNWFRMISRLGDGVFWYTMMGLILVVNGREGLVPVIHMALAGLAGTLLYKWLKGKTLRPRPYQVHQDVWLAGKPLDHFSFPSGHTLHAVAFCGVALFYYPVLAGLLIPFTVMVGISRIILGLHYPSDVLAGALIGSTISSISISLVSGWI
jgi:undecaprenyl-diphosphatase